VDYIVLCPEQKPILGMEEFEPTYSGEQFMTADEFTEFILAHGPVHTAPDREIIARRAVGELRPGMFINIGIGIPRAWLLRRPDAIC
jgi:acyl CoA:acetate/3-ketoacid CoA transferase